MKKSFLLLIICALGGITPKAMAADTITLGECNHKVASGNGYGTDNAGVVKAAVFVPSNKLANLSGNQITEVDFGLSSRVNVREVSVWVRGELDGANLATGSIERGAMGWNEVKLTTPYTIETNCPGLYIGYEFSSAGVSHPVSVVGESNEYKSFVKTPADKEWKEITSQGVVSIEAIVSGNNMPKYDLELVEASVCPDLNNGDNFYTVSGVVRNLAMKNATGFSISVVDEAGNAAVGNARLDSYTGTTVPFTATVSSSTPLSGKLIVTITGLVDGSDANPANNTAEAVLSYRRTVLIEEFTTERCPNCPGAADTLHELLNNPLYAGKALAICHHSAFGTDWLTRDIDNDLVWMFNMDGLAFAPALMYDRQPIFKLGYNQNRYEPIIAPRNDEIFETCLKTALKQPTNAMIDVKVIDQAETSEGTVVTVEVKGICNESYALENGMLNFVTLEDNVKAKSQEGASGTYYHNHVIRTDNGSWGEPVVFENGRFSKTFTLTLLPEWNKNEISFVAFIANRDAENTCNNVVENAAYAKLVKTESGVEKVAEEDLEEAARYDINGVKLCAPVKGLNIVVYKNGATRKIMVK
ncbi:MAG: Omp28-related outer membrane protein [Muribaculum sp.]|nr:Omp28-related outer membrane protein [Muribaculum sp.]